MTKTPPVWTLGDRLRKSMRHAHFVATDMAERLDVNPNTVSNWLNDRTEPSLSHVQAWAQATNVPLAFLLPRLDSNQEPSGLQFHPDSDWIDPQELIDQGYGA